MLPISVAIYALSYGKNVTIKPVIAPIIIPYTIIPFSLYGLIYKSLAINTNEKYALPLNIKFK